MSSRPPKYGSRTPWMGKATPLQDFENLVIGVATPAVRRGLVGYHRAEIKTMRDSEEGETTTTCGSYASWGRVQWNSTRLNDE